MASAKERPKKEMKSTGLRKCFSALVDRKQVNLDIDVLNLILKKELLINTDTLDPNLTEVLPVMLVVYMKSWPGWQRSKEYFTGKLIFKDWYEKFRQYVVLRLNYLVKNGYNSVIEELRKEKKREEEQMLPSRTYIEHGSQTDALAPKSMAPFTICIDCPASAINSVVFSDSGDDIIIRQHPEMPWSQIDMKQLIHWPHVELEFFTPELSFTRRNCFEYNRYINFTNVTPMLEKSEYIDQVEVINPSSGRNCYTLNMLRSYVKEYLSVLRLINNLDTDIAKVEVVLNEFLTDIEEIEMNNTMATNTSVVFNIGRCSFLRNKKISRSYPNTKGSNNFVGYSEVITPKVESSLIFFKGVQDMTTPDVSFSYLNIVKNSLKNNDNLSVHTINPLIVYKCNYCQVRFKDDEEIMTHLQEVHKMDPNMLCTKCKKSFSITYLTSSRWQHACTSQQGMQGPIIVL